MEYMMKFKGKELIVRSCVWGAFGVTLAFVISNGISTLGAVVTVGMLLLAIDYPKKTK